MSFRASPCAFLSNSVQGFEMCAMHDKPMFNFKKTILPVKLRMPYGLVLPGNNPNKTVNDE